MTETNVWTIKRLLDWTTEYFASHGADSSRLDAEILLAEALGCQRIDLYTRFDRVPDEGPLSVFRDWVRRRAQGEPVAYLVGHKEFYSLKFKVNRNVLIPRPETEHLVLKALEITQSFAEPTVTIVDVGTGSGCVAVALARHLPEAQVIAVDISSDAIEVARENIEKHAVQDRVSAVQSDLLESVAARDIDLIVSNPPYIGTAEQGTVEDSVRKYEPAIALFAGETGTELIARLIGQSADVLRTGGHLVFEISPLIVEPCRDLLAADGRFGPAEITKDYSGLARVVSAERS